MAEKPARAGKGNGTDQFAVRRLVGVGRFAILSPRISGKSLQIDGMPYNSFSDTSDEALLVQYANGHPDAAKELMERFAPRILRLAVRMLDDLSEAEEVTQDTMLRLWQIAPDWERGRAKVSTWLWRVAHNLCTDRLRRRRSVGLDEIAEPMDEQPSVDETLMCEYRAHALKEALSALPERQRIAVSLRHLEGIPNPQIAEFLGTSVEAVESLIARGLRALKKQLAKKRGNLGWQT